MFLYTYMDSFGCCLLSTFGRVKRRSFMSCGPCCHLQVQVWQAVALVLSMDDVR